LSHGVHLLQVHDVLFEFVSNILDVSSENAWSIDTLPWLDFELGNFPMGNNFVVQLVLKLELLVSGVSNIFDFVFEVEEVSLQQLVEGEVLWLVVWKFFLGHFNDVLPMSWSDGWLGQRLDEWQHFSHVVNVGFKFLVSIGALEWSWKLLAISSEHFDLLNHGIHLISNVRPVNFVPLSNGVLYLGVERVKLVQKLDFLSGVLKGWILLMGKTEESLSSEVRVVSSLSDLVVLREHLKSVKSFSWLKTTDSWSVLFEVASENLDITLQVVDSDDEALLEVGLLSLKVVSDSLRSLNELVPSLLNDGLGVNLVLLHFSWKVGLEQVVHFSDWSELELNLRLLLSDVFQCVHNVSERVNVLNWFLNLKLDLLDLFSQVVKLDLCLVVKHLGVGIFP